jgi:hypothetical protein
MLAIFNIAFGAPWLLLGLMVLPVLWFLLRAVPPAPIRRRFPAVSLLLGLKDTEVEADKTPWWLMLLRMLAVAAIIIGFSGPVLNPSADAQNTKGPLVIIIDGTWASAQNWAAQLDRIDSALEAASRQGRRAAVVRLTDPVVGLEFAAADVWRSRLAGLAPQPWEATSGPDWVADVPEGAQILWMSDGLAREERLPLLAALQIKSEVTIFEESAPIFGLAPVVLQDGVVIVEALRNRSGTAQDIIVDAVGRDPAGIERVLTQVPLSFAASDMSVQAEIVLPAELRNRVSRFEIEGIATAGAVTLSDDGLLRREIALIDGRSAGEGAQLLSQLYYLERALRPTADLIQGALPDALLANPDVIVLADVANLTQAETQGLTDWVESGGLLLRFSGPRLAASDVARGAQDPLMPVRLRSGGRSVGGAMSWGEPKSLAPFAADTPFYGLDVPADVAVNNQLVAEPDPDLARRVLAELSDGTPLVTRKALGQGQVVLFHITANAEWSNLPLSGLFVQMLERLSISARGQGDAAGDLQGTTWQLTAELNADGRLEAVNTQAGLSGEQLGLAITDGGVNDQVRAGIYTSDARSLALNVLGSGARLAAPDWPSSVVVEGLRLPAEQPLKGWLLSAALAFLSVDIIASLWFAGRLVGPSVAAVFLGALLPILSIDPAYAQGGQPNDIRAIEATAEVSLAHVLTGDARVDEMALAGLRGLSDVLFRRTSVEPTVPTSIDLEIDELAFFPFLYWPITANQPLPSADAYAKLNNYLRTGGMILFDTRDGSTASFGANSPEGKRLQLIAAPLDIPALEPLPNGHVLTRSFYLLQDFPGRHTSRDVWVEVSRSDVGDGADLLAQNRNDGVSPVVIGGNDWAAAWAVSPSGGPMAPIGRGRAGERQREIAYRFGVNLIMYVLTGNYKADQVHVPALLERLGQ